MVYAILKKWWVWLLVVIVLFLLFLFIPLERCSSITYSNVGGRFVPNGSTTYYISYLQYMQHGGCPI